MFTMITHRPRNINAPRAAGMLYGDWGTSKAYVIGLAFAYAGYASFWPLLAVGILSLLVGLNYMTICKYYPNGGGVYASVQKRSKPLALFGAFLLIADYLVTAALSALAAFNYLGVPEPTLFAAFFILLIGCFNYFGPRHSANFALVIAACAVFVFICLALLSLPFLKQAWHHVLPPPKDPLLFWSQFCAVIVALSGIETIANTTSIMQLNKGAKKDQLIVTQTSSPAIAIVMIEVVVLTTLFGLAAAAIGNFHIQDYTVSVPGFPNVGDEMLTYLASVFGSALLGDTFSLVFNYILKIVVTLILLSAVNTAINGLVSLQYLMASDGELPFHFRRLNRYGVPLIPLAAAALLPPILILVFKKVIFLADLYAIGFVGAIATNLGATSTDGKLPLTKRERLLMFVTFCVMAAIELTLFIEKKDARTFVLVILVVGLGLRTLARFTKKPTLAAKREFTKQKAPVLCVVKKMSPALRTAIDESNRSKISLNVVFTRVQHSISESDLRKTGQNDPVAKRVHEYIKQHGNPDLVHYHYCVTDSFIDISIAFAERFEAEVLIVDAPSSKVLAHLRGQDLRTLYKNLPEHITLRSL